MQAILKMWSQAKNQIPPVFKIRNPLALLGVIAGISFPGPRSACAQSLTFSANTYTGPNLAPTHVLALDIFGRGKPDLIGVDGGGTLFEVLTNNGYGTFGSNSLISFSSSQASAVAADVNGDGKPDLIFANGGFTGLLTVLTNNGSGEIGRASCRERVCVPV